MAKFTKCRESEALIRDLQNHEFLSKVTDLFPFVQLHLHYGCAKISVSIVAEDVAYPIWDGCGVRDEEPWRSNFPSFLRKMIAALDDFQQKARDQAILLMMGEQPERPTGAHGDGFNASFYAFKPSGKWGYEGRGILTDAVFEVFSDTLQRAQIIADNEGKFPGMSGPAADYIWVIIPDEDAPQNLCIPLLLRPTGGLVRMG